MKKKYIILILFILLQNSTSFSQTDTAEIYRTDQGQVQYARLLPNINGQATDFLVSLKQLLNCSSNDGFILISDNLDNLGIQHKKYNQTYKGIPVDCCEYLVHGRNGIAYNFNGNFQIINIASVVPIKTESQALALALSNINATKYKWEDSAYQNFASKKYYLNSRES